MLGGLVTLEPLTIAAYPVDVRITGTVGSERLCYCRDALASGRLLRPFGCTVAEYTGIAVPGMLASAVAHDRVLSFRSRLRGTGRIDRMVVEGVPLLMA